MEKNRFYTVDAETKADLRWWRKCLPHHVDGANAHPRCRNGHRCLSHWGWRDQGQAILPQTNFTDNPGHPWCTNCTPGDVCDTGGP